MKSLFPLPPPGRERVREVALWTAQETLAVLFAFAGISKLFGLEPELTLTFDRAGLGQWLRYLTGAIEVAGAVGLLWPGLTAIAALALGLVTAGTVLVHLVVIAPATMAALPPTLGVVSVVVARARWTEDARARRLRRSEEVLFSCHDRLRHRA